MISDPQGTVLALFLTFCRIGGCMMVMPGLSSARIPAQIRIMVALAVSMALMPVLWDVVYPKASAAGATYIGYICAETLVGIMYGMIARLYTLGLQYAGTMISMMIGFNAPGGMDIIEDGQETGLTTLITFSGLMILFVLDFHHIMFKALVDSYTVIPLGGQISMQRTLISITDTLEATSYIMLRLASPFLLYGLMFNVSIGFVNKLAQQIPIYFISAPYLLMGGLFLFYLTIAAMMNQFANAFGNVFIGK